MRRSDADTERFYRALWPERGAVLRTALFLCRNQNEAEDLVQEVFLKAFAAIDKLEEDRGAVPWLMAILRNTRIDRLRSRAAHPTVSLESLDAEPQVSETPESFPFDPSPETLLEALSDQTIIDALHELPEEIRWTLLLVDVHGMELTEAARIEQIPVGTVKSRVHRGRDMLRQLLAGRSKSRLAV
jgi:RNA polymerase sigma-70 factor (ECF subfamily)